MSHDPLIAEAEEAERAAHRDRRAANLFDVRRMIGGLFAIYGVILTILGIGASDADIQKAAGININLWTGLAMLLVAALFLFWAFARPLAEQLEDDDEDGEDGRTARGAPASVGAQSADGAGSQTTRRRPGSDPSGAGGGSTVGRQ